MFCECPIAELAQALTPTLLVRRTPSNASHDCCGLPTTDRDDWPKAPFAADHEALSAQSDRQLVVRADCIDPVPIDAVQ